MDTVRLFRHRCIRRGMRGVEVIIETDCSSKAFAAYTTYDIDAVALTKALMTATTNNFSILLLTRL